MEQLLDTVVKPQLGDNEFTEPHTLYHYWLDHEQVIGGANLGGFSLKRTHRFFRDGINDSRSFGSGDEGRWTNLDAEGVLPSDTYRFFVDSMAIMFQTTYEPFYRLLYQLQAKFIIANQQFTPWLLGIRLPQGGGVTGYSPNFAYLNNGVATAMALYDFPQVIEIEQTTDRFEVDTRWNRYYQGENADAGTDPVAAINNWLEANLGPDDTAGHIFFGVELLGVRVRRVS
jgi:hypothetical protein